MPSCVVKNCRNNSMDVRKDTGVTFHKFPKDVNWKFKWTKVIRACRDQESWVPSKFSVVCSVHFAEGDIYVTPGGNRRITKNAVPSLRLYEKIPRRMKDDPPPVENISVSVQTNYIASGDDDETITGDLRESTGTHIDNVIIKVEPMDIAEGTNEIETQTEDVHEIVIKVEPKEIITTSTDPLDPQQESAEFNLIARASYEQKIKLKKEQLSVSRRKIKILRQKMNRLQKRNLKLKNILKEIKEKKLIDKHIFRKLTAGLATKDDE